MHDVTSTHAPIFCFHAQCYSSLLQDCACRKKKKTSTLRGVSVVGWDPSTRSRDQPPRSTGPALRTSKTKNPSAKGTPSAMRVTTPQRRSQSSHRRQKPQARAHTRRSCIQKITTKTHADVSICVFPLLTSVHRRHRKMSRTAPLTVL